MTHEPARTTGRLEGKVAIVTASGSGIGRGIAHTFGREGAAVVVASLGREECEKTVADIESASGAAIAVPTNVGKRDEVFAMVDACLAEYGKLDILVNVAQSYGTEVKPAPEPNETPLQDFDEAELDWTFKTGAMGTFWGMKAAYPHLRERGGKIINFASIFGQMGQPGFVAYACAKEAIRAMSRVAAREWAADKINVNVINPAAKTDVVSKIAAVNPELVAQMEAQVPLGRLGDPEGDIGPVALFLASPDSDYVTGLTINADGGMFITA